MAVEPPTQFIDQDYHHEASSLSKNKSKSTNSSYWSCFGSSDCGSVLNSPIESELGSTETESEESEEDYMAELSRQMAYYMLQDDNNHDHHHHHDKQEKVSWSSSAASPSLSTFWPPLDSTHEGPKVQSKQSLIDDQIRAVQYYKLNLKKDQSMKKNQNKKRANIVDPQSSNPVRAVFLEGPGSETKSSSGGTGVFLPQKIGHASESRKKRGCSTVLIPARVVQALKQHFDKVGVPSRFNGDFPLQDGLNNNSSSNSQQQQPAPVSNHQEIALPQEWTY
ncbi:G patch domain-containing protein [Citrus sinensis]|uniref:G patch domain-containing protein n=1 Tax=Citrus sinensis TaxID=2711 RepID=A0ACB8IW86_CITSI|nr:G patch domain-containing protein [Citrus sinensis]